MVQGDARQCLRAPSCLAESSPIMLDNPISMAGARVCYTSDLPEDTHTRTKRREVFL